MRRARRTASQETSLTRRHAQIHSHQSHYTGPRTHVPLRKSPYTRLPTRVMLHRSVHPVHTGLLTQVFSHGRCAQVWLLCAELAQCLLHRSVHAALERPMSLYTGPLTKAPLCRYFYMKFLAQILLHSSVHRQVLLQRLQGFLHKSCLHRSVHAQVLLQSFLHTGQFTQVHNHHRHHHRHHHQHHHHQQQLKVLLTLLPEPWGGTLWVSGRMLKDGCMKLKFLYALRPTNTRISSLLAFKSRCYEVLIYPQPI